MTPHPPKKQKQNKQIKWQIIEVGMEFEIHNLISGGNFSNSVVIPERKSNYQQDKSTNIEGNENW